MSFFVNRFLGGKWFAKSNSILSNRKKVLLLISTLRSYMKNGGLKKVRKDLMLLVSPLDFIPDFIPFGFADDIAIITWAMAKIGGELSKYSQWKSMLITTGSLYDDIEEVSYEEVD